MARIFPGGAVQDRITYDAAPLYPYSHRHTFACWAYRTSDDASSIWRLFGDSAGNNRWLIGAVCRIFIYSSGVYEGYWSPPSPPLNAWYHIAVTHDTTTVGTAPTLYINSVAQSLGLTDVWDTPVSTADSALRFGNGPAGNLGWYGRIQNAALWSDVLSLAEIQALNRGVSPHRIRTGKLTFHYPMLGTAGEGDWASGRAGVIVGTTAAPALVPSGPLIVV